ncbi:hypothetical protein CHLRE_09g390726v5 [Chlamydomonas reinhardtii]|uniref:Uncharacterized protein n=1 Tax=Chlamydomonas reinhardtii TaxID=3055 RepID=A0A2K3DE48_CHLRE|nr:uncharacterized protein CHLRE_09g390726v5 [Chlamydomonas reinhardtii]PNW78806.1 hypothetical protein CHLRE_09g390726v5 [Chlamydomonas reinhardtii]
MGVIHGREVDSVTREFAGILLFLRRCGPTAAACLSATRTLWRPQPHRGQRPAALQFPRPALGQRT